MAAAGGGRARSSARAVPWTVAAALVLVAGCEVLVNHSRHELTPSALVLNVVLLLAVLEMLLAVSGSAGLAWGATATLYLTLSFANAFKVQHLQSAVHPLDVRYLGELWTLDGFRSVRPELGMIVAGVAGLLWAGRLALRRLAFDVPTWRRRALAGIGSAAAIALVAYAPTSATLARGLPLLGVHWPHWNSSRAARENGVLLNFVLHLSDGVSASPPGYGRDAVTAIATRPDLRPARSDRAAAEPANVVLYMVESLMDTDDLHLRFTEDPTPTLHRLRAATGKSWAITPGFGGYSANTEFELLTGFSMRFLPENSCPYLQYVNRDVPSLVRLFKENGYTTTAVHAGALTFYNYLQVYPHLGFDRFLSIATEPTTTLDTAGRCPSDESMVDAIIRESDAHPRFFTFAFPMSTHWPYDYAARYAGSSLDLVDAPLSAAARDEVKTYVNALHAADAALAKLVAHYAGDARRTIVVVLGDHLPPLSDEVYRAAGLAADGTAATELRRHRTPVAVWANFPLDGGPVQVSTNFLGARVAERAGVEPGEFLAFNRRTGERLGVLSPYQLMGKPTPASETDPMLADYRMLQYDLMFGQQYFASLTGELRR